jgi:hypothetical protein
MAKARLSKFNPLSTGWGISKMLDTKKLFERAFFHSTYFKGKY